MIDRLERLARSSDGSAALNAAQWEALRYLARANRFSRTPAALADYLGSTRGTVSQTLIVLEQKGYLTRRPSERDRRSVHLELTALARQKLKTDPLLKLAAELERVPDADLQAVVATLRSTLLAAVRRNDGRTFGACQTCMHFRRGAGPSARSPHRCALLNEPLSDADSEAICVEQEAAA